MQVGVTNIKITTAFAYGALPLLLIVGTIIAATFLFGSSWPITKPLPLTSAPSSMTCYPKSSTYLPMETKKAEIVGAVVLAMIAVLDSIMRRLA